MKPTKSFFAKNNFIGLVVGALLVYASLLVGAGVQHKIAQITRTNAIKARQAKFNSLSPAEKAIRKAEAYQANVITGSQPNQRLLYDYIQRTYSLDRRLGVAATPLSVPKEGEYGYVEEFYYMARIAFPDVTSKVPPKDNLTSLSLTNVYSVNCDNIALPANFWDTMQQNYEAGGYYLTHDALALQFMKDNDCVLPASEAALSNSVVQGMAEIAADKATESDLRYEAIAFLQLMGHRDLIRKQWIDQVIAEQKSDGSWISKNRSISSDHTTFLALWALLQYSRPEVRYQPLIRHVAN